MLGKLKLRKKVKVVDGDNRVFHTQDPTLKRTLESLIDSDMSFNVIQIFHYASIHYETKWDKYPIRFLTALLMCSNTIKYNLDHLALNDREEPELKGSSSEILALGLSIMFMCKWYQTNINKFEKIGGNKKRCDYKFNYNNQIIVFEVRGRSNKNDIKTALKDCIEKKENTSGDIKYSTICHLPRDESPVTLYLYDPPIDNNDEYNEYYPILKHYRNICKKVGLTILSKEISNRIKRFEEVGEWSVVPIEMEGVIKLGTDITIGDQVFWSRNLMGKQEKLPFFVQFGLEKRVIEVLENWNLIGLKELYYQEHVYENDGSIYSILSDGSLLYIGEERL